MSDQPRHPKGDPRGGQFAPKPATTKLAALKQAAQAVKQQRQKPQLTPVSTKTVLREKAKEWDSFYDSREAKALITASKLDRVIAGKKNSLIRLESSVGIHPRVLSALTGGVAVESREQAISVVRSHLKQLEEDRRTTAQAIKMMGLEGVDYDIVSNNSYIYGEIRDTLTSRGKVMGVADKDGNLQALAVHNLRKNSLHVGFLATAPWNLTKTDPRSVKGGGASVLAHLARESQKQGRNGVIELEPISSAKPFYEYLGFKDKNEYTMILDRAAAQKLIEKYG